MHISTLLFGCGLAPFALAAYSVQDDYSGNNFFSLFTFDTENDPTSGYVNYVDSATAQADNLTSVNNGIVTIASDSTNVASGRGRNSIRLTSTKQYTHALVVLDLAHMPGSAVCPPNKWIWFPITNRPTSQCGIWPAFWMFGPSWPNSGEIDVIEGVSLQAQDAITMHTGPSCSMIGKSCEGSDGCSTQVGGPTSFGDGFNNNGGGIYAMEWTSDYINVYFFPHSSAPGDILGAAPDPTTWGTPTASFVGGSTCDIDASFQNNNIVFDTTFCGSWAGTVWSSDPVCGPKAATCQDYVQNNPSAFTEAYWTINSLRVYSEASSSTAAVAAVEDDAPGPSSTSAAAPVVQATNGSVPVAAPSPSPSAPASSGAVALGSPADGGAVSETPVPSKRRAEHLRRHRTNLGGMWKHS